MNSMLADRGTPEPRRACRKAESWEGARRQQRHPGRAPSNSTRDPNGNGD